jgi:hypothetical protein
MALQSCAIVGEAKRRKKSPSRWKPRLTRLDVLMMDRPPTRAAYYKLRVTAWAKLGSWDNGDLPEAEGAAS